MTDSRKPEVAVYYFPNYHVDPRNEATHGAGWNEWELVRRATPRFPGHEQPKVPLWGYLDESKPETAEKQIAAAADHGIDAFIYDWYWYEDGAFLNKALENGFLQASNNDRLKFSLMWANHDWINIFPYKRGMDHTLLHSGQVSLQAFEAACDYMIEKYFGHPSYWRVEGGLYFSVYELMSLIQSLGGIEQTKAALDGFRVKVRDAGLGELHLNAVVWGIQNLPGERTLENPGERVRELGFDSVTSYVWIHHIALESYPTVDYPAYAKMAEADWGKFRKQFGDYGIPYYPNVSMGWDSSPRTVQSDVHANIGYPFTPVLVGNTPEAFRQSLAAAKAFIETTSADVPPILTINSWNEWTEGSYIEPDTVNGMGYLEAIRSVFGKS
ncbi:glycoside hydrolase family 99-like domain-containing protein [Cohnella ginsengisoli]|uniref:Glycoside hydrolase family 99-like domain-containing protein n=1 Tax=Cohnella ginsengisoli TaxID=425004 RepID=A0A9X4QLA8_9BACL|nr:glycoside hydrolase family 99-like domain-containing protein [Cohnella ginsengisoli]MDG0790549.1 glycoside hydrolase family 99-like domain-containing protein [Cohnella ginsengisoli]